MDQIIGAARSYWRSQRMRLFLDTMRPQAGARILDVGGTPELWKLIDTPVSVTLLNLTPIVARFEGFDRQRFDIIEGDICLMPEIAQCYDMVFSNSVLEHVGSERRQQAFASAVSMAPAYWVQIPAPSFPIEVHCRQPFWWLWPPALRRRQIARWKRRKRNFLARQMAGTRPISRSRLLQMFPDGELEVERMMGLPKSFYIYKRRMA